MLARPARASAAAMAERDLQRRRAPMAVRSNARAELQHGGTGWAQWARAGAADAPLQDGRTQARPAGERNGRRNRWFLPNGVFTVSWCVGWSEDFVSPIGNDVYKFSSLSSLIRLTCQHFTYVAPHLIEIETTIKIPLGLPLGHSQCKTLSQSLRQLIT